MTNAGALESASGVEFTSLDVDLSILPYLVRPDPPDSVCPHCLVDPDLRRWVRANASLPTCGVCHRVAKQPIAADFDEFVEHVGTCIEAEYEDASEMVPVEGGEYVFPGESSEDLLFWRVPDISDNEDLVTAIAAALPDKYWVQRDFFSLTPFDGLRSGWSEFARLIKYETRFLFFPARPPRGIHEDPNDVRPEDMLEALGRFIRSERLVKRLPVGTMVYRVRAHGEEEAPCSATELGPPPAELVRQSNRMSPAGISMLYVALDRETAIAETLSSTPGPSGGTLAVFELLDEARVVDFVRLRRRPTLFTPESDPAERAPLQFLHSLAHEFSLPIARDGREHVEYVPTQVVTEYLRYRYRPKRPVHGIRYRSAKRGPGINLALFLSAEDFDEGTLHERRPPRLRLVSWERVTLPPAPNTAPKGGSAPPGI